MANEKRLVWTEDVMSFLCKRCNEMYSDDPCEPSDCLMIEELEKCPTVDAVEVVHGRWLPDMEEFDDDPAIGIRGGVFQTGWKCSICGRTEQTKEPYCNCGNNIRTEDIRFPGIIQNHCAIDSHRIGYIECFECWCKHWKKDRKWGGERKNYEG